MHTFRCNSLRLKNLSYEQYYHGVQKADFGFVVSVAWLAMGLLAAADTMLVVISSSCVPDRLLAARRHREETTVYMLLVATATFDATDLVNQVHP